MASGILIVDDLAFMRDAIRSILSENGIPVAGEAANGREAVRRYRELRPEAVILDITMPEMDGLSAIRRIRSIDPKAKIIMCSALGQQEYLIKAIHLGARDFIVKPFRAERIISAVTRAIGRHG